MAVFSLFFTEKSRKSKCYDCCKMLLLDLLWTLYTRNYLLEFFFLNVTSVNICRIHIFVNNPATLLIFKQIVYIVEIILISLPYSKSRTFFTSCSERGMRPFVRETLLRYNINLLFFEIVMQCFSIAMKEVWFFKENCLSDKKTVYHGIVLVKNLHFVSNNGHIHCIAKIESCLVLVGWGSFWSSQLILNSRSLHWNCSIICGLIGIMLIQRKWFLRLEMENFDDLLKRDSVK